MESLLHEIAHYVALTIEGIGIAIIAFGALEAVVRRRATLADLGVTVRSIESSNAIAVESASGLLDAPHAQAAADAAAHAGMRAQPVFTYLANTLRSASKPMRFVGH